MRRRSTILALLALGAAGCGGDDEESGLSKEDFIAKADAICAEANKQEAAIVREGPGWHSGPKFSDPELMTEFTAVGRGAVRRLRALEAPEEQRAAFAEVLVKLDVALDAIEKEIAEQRANKRGGTSANSITYETAYSDVAAVAGRAGLTECQGVAY